MLGGGIVNTWSDSWSFILFLGVSLFGTAVLARRAFGDSIRLPALLDKRGWPIRALGVLAPVLVLTHISWFLGLVLLAVNGSLFILDSKRNSANVPAGG